MISAPYYILAVGIVMVIIAAFIGASGPSKSATMIDARMSDREIARRMRKQETGGASGVTASVIGGLGILLTIISVAWRLLGIGYE